MDFRPIYKFLKVEGKRMETQRQLAELRALTEATRAAGGVEITTVDRRGRTTSSRWVR